jgi:hypothetical protein
VVCGVSPQTFVKPSSPQHQETLTDQQLTYVVSPNVSRPFFDGIQLCHNNLREKRNRFVFRKFVRISSCFPYWLALKSSLSENITVSFSAEMFCASIVEKRKNEESRKPGKDAEPRNRGQP